ncbi:MAG: metal-dependent hydrolase [Ammonifex sp.]|jgi:inner membrane protein|nr:MAG: metal-dependent hydrolase [Ammonifex sp.]
MLWRTHFIGGMLAGTGTALLFHSDPLLFAGVAGFASLLPDLDSPKSFVGREVWPASASVEFALGHRGPLHSLLGAALFSLLAGLILRRYHLPPELLPGAAAGYLSHLFLDILNSDARGIPLLWPLKPRFQLPLVRTGSPLEKLAFYPLAAAAAWFLFRAVAA